MHQQTMIVELLKIKDMKTNTTKLNANLKEMKQLVKAYAEAEKVNYNARNCRDYDKSKEDMIQAFDAMMGLMREMVSDMNVLGTSCGAMNIRDYFRIEEKTL